MIFTAVLRFLGLGCVQTSSALSVLSFQDFPERVVAADAVNCFQSNVAAVFSETALLISY